MVYTHYHHYYIGTFGIVSPSYDNRRMDLQAPKVKQKHAVRIFFPDRGRDRQRYDYYNGYFLHKFVSANCPLNMIDRERERQGIKMSEAQIERLNRFLGQ